MSDFYGLASLLAKSYECVLADAPRTAAGIADVAGSIEELEEVARHADNAISGITNGLIGIGKLMMAYDETVGGMDDAAIDIGHLLAELSGALQRLNGLKARAAAGLEMKMIQAGEVAQ
jgi:hypothetical protein